MRKKINCLTFSLILIGSTLLKAQLPFPLPAPQDTTQFGRYLQRTMKLLGTSTPTQRNTVKILVYGQSIAKQEWSDTVRKYLKLRFPHANLIMINRSIGGCWAGCLQDPMEYDIKTFYPDLVMFDVYGWNTYGGEQGREYEGIIRFMREHTTAEIAMQNHHVTGTDRRNDNSDFIRMANLYKVELIDIRTPWLKYLTDNNITNANDLTSDGTHLNNRGNFLMARLWLPYLQYKPQFSADPESLMTTYKVGVDINFVNGTLVLPFIGNKIDLVGSIAVPNADSAHIFIDGQKPSAIPGTVMLTRPNEPYDTVFSYANRFDWPWQKGAIMKFNTPNQNLIPEDWNLQISNFNASANFRFNVSGSKTGADGTGLANISGNAVTGSTFTSTSGLISFAPNKFWFDKGPYSNAYTLGNGFQITWQAKAFFTDTYIAPTTVTSAVVDNIVVLAQGLTNSNHVLSIIGFGSENMPIKEIRIYRPYFNRSKVTIASPELVKKCAEELVDISTNYSDNTGQTGALELYSDRNSRNKILNRSASTYTGIVYLVRTVNSTNLKSIASFSIKQGPICTPNLILNLPSDALCKEKEINLANFYSDANSVSGISTYWTDLDTSIPFEGDPTKTHPTSSLFIKKTSSIDDQYYDIKELSLLSKVCKPLLDISKTDTVCATTGYDFRTKTVSDLNSTSAVPNLEFVKDTTDSGSKINTEIVQTTLGSYFAKITSDSALTTYKLAIVIKNCSTTGIKASVDNENFNVFPNPTDGLFQISWNKSIKPTEITIMNAIGVEISKMNKFESELISIQLKDQTKGMYLIKIATQNGIKIIKLAYE